MEMREMIEPTAEEQMEITILIDQAMGTLEQLEMALRDYNCYIENRSIRKLLGDLDNLRVDMISDRVHKFERPEPSRVSGK
jgi:hypothetical protein